MAYSNAYKGSPSRLDRDGRSAIGDALQTSVGAKVLLVLLYVSLNMSLNILNKWILTRFGFPFPLLLSISHQVRQH